MQKDNNESPWLGLRTYASKADHLQTETAFAVATYEVIEWSHLIYAVHQVIQQRRELHQTKSRSVELLDISLITHGVRLQLDDQICLQMLRIFSESERKAL